jgi:hypothetical protein
MLMTCGTKGTGVTLHKMDKTYKPMNKNALYPLRAAMQRIYLFVRHLLMFAALLFRRLAAAIARCWRETGGDNTAERDSSTPDDRRSETLWAGELCSIIPSADRMAGGTSCHPIRRCFAALTIDKRGAHEHGRPLQSRCVFCRSIPYSARSAARSARSP